MAPMFAWAIPIGTELSIVISTFCIRPYEDGGGPSPLSVARTE
ncbi:unknown protein [Desulfotalea psychrophila LSv54]|uniref:Uncharacterized protein n=1 Tax=Desulfotalea psychrophila (strain LSv54 / DSM 12343) TaxID=177439 RepID=Q6AQ06_DESPS|nr:unknown protein [Desulfotalea psychrophila LSv54]